MHHRSAPINELQNRHRPRTAQRLTFHLLRPEEVLPGDRHRRSEGEDRVCSLLTWPGELCTICADPRRDQLLCVVERPTYHHRTHP
jgi:recombinational DNA repair protein RecR